MSEEDREILERAAKEGAMASWDACHAIRVLSQLALEALPPINIEQGAHFRLPGIEADGFITLHPKLS